MRNYIDENISIDGRNIPYKLVTAADYFTEKYNYNEDQLDEFIDSNYEIYTLINQIMALKQSCFLMRRVSYSCGSLSESLYELKEKLEIELSEKSFNFDDEFVESYGNI